MTKFKSIFSILLLTMLSTTLVANAKTTNQAADITLDTADLVLGLSDKNAQQDLKELIAAGETVSSVILKKEQQIESSKNTYTITTRHCGGLSGCIGGARMLIEVLHDFVGGDMRTTVTSSVARLRSRSDLVNRLEEGEKSITDKAGDLVVALGRDTVMQDLLSALTKGEKIKNITSTLSQKPSRKARILSNDLTIDTVHCGNSFVCLGGAKQIINVTKTTPLGPDRKTSVRVTSRVLVKR